MALKYTIDSLDDVTGSHRALYVKSSNGGFVLALEGEPPGYVKASKLDEFRDNNRALNAKVSELETKLQAGGGTDETAEALAAKLKAFEGVDPTEHQSLKALAPRVAELESTLAAEREAAAKANFHNSVSVAFLKAGGRESAVDYMVSMAEKSFSLKDGKLTSSAFSAKDPGEPLSIGEWLQNQRHDLSFAFQPSRGGGTPPGAGGGGNHTPTARTIIAAGDPVEFGKNLEAIVRGDAVVRGF